MIGFFAKLLMSRNPALTLAHATRLARIGLGVALIIVGVGGFLLWDYLDDKAVRERVNIERDLENMKRNQEANRKAGEEKRERDEREAADQEELEDVVDEAESSGRSAADDLWDSLFDK